MEKSKQIGKCPFERDQMVDALDEFEALYKERPVKNNQGGMQSPHLFATWFMARFLAPETIIESGIWKGQGTWMLEQACPHASIYSMDLNLSKREYISQNVTYYENDFTEVDWSDINPSTTLAFFDDHQNAYSRLQLCKWYGIRHIIFEDNYPSGEGDFYTLKKIFAGSGFGPKSSKSSGQEYRSLSAKIGRKLRSKLQNLGLAGIATIPNFSRSRINPNTCDLQFLLRNIEVYTEFPPIIQKPGYLAPEPLLDTNGQSKYSTFRDEAGSYNGICYVKLKCD